MQPRSEETRGKILEAAYRLFSERGYDVSSVAEICTFAGVSKGAFYYHFPSKQALFIALLETWLAGLDAAFAIVIQDAPGVDVAILRMAEMASGVMKQADVRLSILLEFWMQAYRDPAIWEAAIAPYRRYREFFSGLIREGIAEGTLSQIDADLAARTLVSLSMGLVLQAAFDPVGADWASESLDSLRLVMHGLGSIEL